MLSVFVGSRGCTQSILSDVLVAMYMYAEYT